MTRRNLTAKRRKEIHDRDGGRCKKCRSKKYLEVHHIVEVVAGGGDEDSNLDTLCSSCHAEWTWLTIPDVTYEQWLKLPPAGVFVSTMQKLVDRQSRGEDTELKFADLFEMFVAFIRNRP